MINEELHTINSQSDHGFQFEDDQNDIIMKAKKHAAELIKRQTSQIDRYNMNQSFSSNKTTPTPNNTEKKNTNNDSISLDDSSSTEVSVESTNGSNSNGNSNVDNLLAKFRQQQFSSNHHVSKSQGYSTPKTNILNNKTTSSSPYRMPSHSNSLYLNNSNLLNGKSINKQEFSQPPIENNEPNSKSNDTSAYKKRKRDVYDIDDEDFRRRVQKKIDSINDYIDKMDEETENSNSDLYSLFNDLQGISADFGISFETPELVVVGMQSDGKSSFIEGLLGFQFNIVDTNIGTRRPLIIQMINNQERDTPSCRFRKDREISIDEDPFEEYDTPVHTLSSEIQRRTNELVGTNKDYVSDRPIILRVEYKHCSNLTIYDTPGFRLGGVEPLKSNIEKMVMKIMEPKHRIIICLEQSTTEWANTLSRPIVARIDPTFSRTVFVNTKFDNRVKELRDAEQSNTYLEGEGIPENIKPFFISMPVRRNLDPQRFKYQMKESFLDDYRNLLLVGFDEEKYGKQIGIFNLKLHLEKLLQEKYLASVSPTLNLLDSMIDSSRAELEAVKKEMEESDMENQKHKVISFVKAFASLVDRLLQGSVIGDPNKYGQTLEEERIASGMGEWKVKDFDISSVVDENDIPNKDFKIYGGAQYYRLMSEFSLIAHSIEFPKTSLNEVVSCLGISKSHNVPSYETAASDIVQIKTRTTLIPLASIVLKRCIYIMKRLFDIAYAIISSKHKSSSPSSFIQIGEEDNYSVISEYEQFGNVLRSVYDDFVKRVAIECEKKIYDDFETFTKILDFDLLSGIKEMAKDYNYLSPTIEETKERVSNIMNENGKLFFEDESQLGPRNGNDYAYKRVLMMAGKLFAGVRFFFIKHVRSKFNAFFLDPMFSSLGSHLISYFSQLTPENYEEIFNLGHERLKERARILTMQLHKIIENRERFKEVLKRIREAQK